MPSITTRIPARIQHSVKAWFCSQCFTIILLANRAIHSFDGAIGIIHQLISNKLTPKSRSRRNRSPEDRGAATSNGVDVFVEPAILASEFLTFLYRSTKC